MKTQYIVETHLGDFITWAVSEKKAIANVRFRLFGREFFKFNQYINNWKVKEIV